MSQTRMLRRCKWLTTSFPKWTGLRGERRECQKNEKASTRQVFDQRLMLKVIALARCFTKRPLRTSGRTATQRPLAASREVRN